MGSSEFEVDSDWEREFKQEEKAFKVKKQVKMYACDHPGCDRVFSKAGRLAVHRLTHTGERPHVCPKCNVSYTRASHLKRHVESVHEQGQFFCDHSGCEAVLRSSEHLKRHVRLVHGTPKSRLLTCDQCDKVFIKRSQLAAHAEVEHGVASEISHRPHACQKCEKSFAYASQLKRHVQRWHQPKARRKCQHCTLTFDDHNRLRSHVADTHTQRVRCPNIGCSRTFLSGSEALSRHAEKCEGGRAGSTTSTMHICDVPGCGCKYMHYRNLLEHKKRAHDGQAYVCDREGCGKRFLHKKSLLAHREKNDCSAGRQGKGLGVKPRAPRKDKGLLKTTLGSILPGVLGGCKLRAAQPEVISAEAVVREINGDPTLKASFLDPRSDEDDDATGAHLCQVNERNTTKLKLHLTAAAAAVADVGGRKS